MELQDNRIIEMNKTLEEVSESIEQTTVEQMIKILEKHGRLVAVQVEIGGLQVSLCNSEDVLPVLKTHHAELVKHRAGEISRYT